MEKMREVAMLSIGRAVFFGGFAVSLVMLGFAYDFALALRAGAILTMGMALILLYFAQTAHGARPERTEAWLLLKAGDRPENDHARRVFREVLQETYLFFAGRAFIFAVTFLAISFLLRIIGFEGGLGSAG